MSLVEIFIQWSAKTVIAKRRNKQGKEWEGNMGRREGRAGSFTVLLNLYCEICKICSLYKFRKYIKTATIPLLSCLNDSISHPVTPWFHPHWFNKASNECQIMKFANGFYFSSRWRHLTGIITTSLCYLDSFSVVHPPEHPFIVSLVCLLLCFDNPPSFGIPLSLPTLQTCFPVQCSTSHLEINEIRMSILVWTICDCIYTCYMTMFVNNATYTRKVCNQRSCLPHKTDPFLFISFSFSLCIPWLNKLFSDLSPQWHNDKCKR